MTSSPRTFNVQEAKSQLSRLLRAVETGEEIHIARSGKVVARLVRVAPEAPREWGCFAGQVEHTEDAFAPLDRMEEGDVELWDDVDIVP